MRLFVAVRLPEGIRQAIAEFQSELKNTLREAEIRWTPPEQFHLTLRFLGNVRSGEIATLEARLSASCSNFPPLTLRVEKLGFFPHARSPRVVWIGITDASGQLMRLHAAVESAVADDASERGDRRFAGHLTLGRVKRISRGGVDRLTTIAAANATRTFGAWHADSIDLMRSELFSDGARHLCLCSIPLRG